jgi:hypothetical protein
MKNRFPTVLLLCAVLAAGCGASKPEPPRSLCGIKTPASAIAPLLPEEGERVTEKRERSPSAENSCTVSVDDHYYFEVKHDPDGQNYSIFPSDSLTRKQPRTFQGELGIASVVGDATATCPGGKKVYAGINLNVEESDKLYANSGDDLEKFLNAYMPAVQKHYGCKS